MNPNWNKTKIYASLALFCLVNVLIFQNFESSFGVRKSKTDFSSAIDQAEKESLKTSHQLDLSSEAEMKNTQRYSRSQPTSHVQADAPMKLTLKRAPTATRKKNKSLVALQKNKKASVKKKSSSVKKKSVAAKKEKSIKKKKTADATKKKNKKSKTASAHKD